MPAPLVLWRLGHSLHGTLLERFAREDLCAVRRLRRVGLRTLATRRLGGHELFASSGQNRVFALNLTTSWMPLRAQLPTADRPCQVYAADSPGGSGLSGESDGAWMWHLALILGGGGGKSPRTL